MALAVGFALLAAAGFGAGSIFIRLATQGLSPMAVAFYVVVVGAVVALIPALAVNLDEITSLPAIAFAWILLMAAMAYPIARLFNYTAISMVGAARTAPLGTVAPIFSVALAITILGERPNLLVVLGTPVIVVGLVLVVIGGTGSSDTGLEVVTNKLGYPLGIAAALVFGGRDVVSRHVVSGVAPPLVTSALALLFGVVMLLIITHREVARSIGRVPARYIWICVVAGMCQGVAAISVLQALSRAPLTVISPIYSSTPLFVLILAHLFLKRLESITPLLVIGTTLSVGGVVIVIVGAGT